MFTFILVLIIMGLLVGLVARFLVPGRDPMPIWMTLAVGVVATLVAGLIGRAFFGADGRFGSWLFALVIAIGIVLLLRRVRPGGTPTR